MFENQFLQKSINTCETHGEYESIFMAVSNKWTRCPICVKQESAKKTQSEIEQNFAESRKNIVESVLKRAAIPEAYVNKSFADYTCKTEEMKKVYNHCKYYANHFNEAIEKNIHGVFVGNTRTGKTHLAIAILNEIIKKGYTGTFVKMADIILAIKASWGSKETNENAVLKTFIDLDLLVIDECAINADEREKDKLFYIVDKRYERRKPVIIISNEINELKKKIGDRIVARLMESNFVKIFSWEGRGISEPSLLKLVKTA